MPFLTNLAIVARRTGYPVTEVAGWRTRGHGPQPEVRGIVCHHTAGPVAGGDYPSLQVVRDGRRDLRGPLSQLGLGRSGRIYVIAAGRCWHNAPSTSPLHDNSSSIGIEAENSGSQSWPAVQIDAYQKLVAELCREYGVPVAQVKAHREVNTGKPDPRGIDMRDFRASVAVLLKPGGSGAPKPPQPVEELPVVDGIPVFQGSLKVTSPLMHSVAVRTWQKAAKRLVPRIKVDDWYGPESREVCRDLQRLFAIPVTGVVDEETWVITFAYES